MKANVASACKRKDPEILGELLDSLKALGLGLSHPLIKRGAKYLLAEQNDDGSWGDASEDNDERVATQPGQRSMAYVVMPGAVSA